MYFILYGINQSTATLLRDVQTYRLLLSMLFWFAFLGTHLNYCTWNIPLMLLILYDSLYIFIDKDAD